MISAKQLMESTVFQEVLQEGMEKGLQQGLAEGERRALQRQLAKRFGPLPEWAAEKIAAADTALLDLWLDRFIDGESLDSIFSL